VSPSKTVELIEIPSGMWTRVGPAGNYLWGPDTPWEGALLRGMTLGFSPYCSAAFLLGLTGAGRRSVSSVILNFASEKSPCYAESCQNSLTTCLENYVFRHKNTKSLETATVKMCTCHAMCINFHNVFCTDK